MAFGVLLLLKAGGKVNAYAPALRASDPTAYPKHLLAISLCKPKTLTFWSVMFLLPDGHSKASICAGSLNFASARNTDTKGWRQK
jgi:hypothetical protein